MAASIKAEYRPDIDGLRAIAILSVLLFHAFPAVLPGGFVGVDVFFVISGYLISRIVIEDAERGGFSYLEFYSRRARRILPAFFVVSAISFAIGFFVLFPIELKRMAMSLVAATFFLANLFFYQTSDYFDSAASQIPLLHYWSLGVEEQFYVLFPVAILLIQKRLPKALTIITAAAFLISLAASEYLVQTRPPAGFFLLPSRGWELMAGTLAFLFSRKIKLDHYLTVAVAVVGAIMLLASIGLLNQRVSFPGLHALPACVGTALIIWSGANDISALHRLLGAAPFRGIGKISFTCI